MIRILIAEDDILFAQTLEDFLTEEGYAVDLCHSGTEAEDRCYEKRYDLLLLDIHMPGLGGIDLLRAIRRSGDATPAIYLTSYREKEMLMAGFDAGADDYLRKPVDLDELRMRIVSVLRRANKLQETIRIGRYTYDKQQKLLSGAQHAIPLSAKLAALLDLLSEHPDTVVTKEQIKSHLWAWDETPSDGALRVYINELKKILGREHIENIKGRGYRLAL